MHSILVSKRLAMLPGGLKSRPVVERRFGVIEGVSVGIGLRIGLALTLTCLTSIIQRLLLLLDSLVPVHIFDVEIHRVSRPGEYPPCFLCSDCNIHAPEHILLGVREVVFIHRIGDILPWVLVWKLASVRAFLWRFVPTGLQLAVQETPGKVHRIFHGYVRDEILGIP